MAKVSKFTVRTSGRRVFRRCLRKWGFQSSMRMNLQRKGTESNIHFWFGSAIHFAMEDFFGYNRFGDLVKAFQAYYAAFPAYDRPEGADSHYSLGMGMLDYFKQWYVRHNQDYQFQTVWLDADKQEVAPGTPGASPLVEESFLLDLGKKVWVREDTEEIVEYREPPKEQQEFDMFGSVCTKGQWYPLYCEMEAERLYFVERATADTGDLPINEGTKVYVVEVPVYYHGTMDRIVRDQQGRWWIMDWKTAKSADTGKLDTDDQISAYMWAAEQWFQRPIHGFMYVQLTKELPHAPKRIANGSLSTDKKQKTTHALLREQVLKDYGEVRKAPNKVIDFLNALAELETPEGDRFVRWDAVLRNKAQKISTYHHVMGEVNLMTDPELPLFPNPTRDCSWDCNFRDACLMMDRGETDRVQAWLDENFEQRPREEDGNIDSWRENIPWPDSAHYEAIGSLVEEMATTADDVFNIILPDKYKD